MAADLPNPLLELIIATNRLARHATLHIADSRSSAQYRVLGTLDNAGPMRIGDLAAYERLSQPGTTKLTLALEADGLIVRESDPHDGRVAIVNITEDGRAALQLWRSQIAEALEPLSAALTTEQGAVVRRAADIIRTQIQKAGNAR
jgi:DNA-binding MarR family transcriptional regulator